MDENMKLTSFVEKPENPTSSLIGTLVYMIQKTSLLHIDAVVKSGKADRA